MWWTTEQELKLMKKFNDDFINGVMWGFPTKKLTPEEEYRNHLKYAYVFIGDKRKMLFVHNENMKAYKTEMYDIVEPLEEVKYDKFERWCRGMDL